MRLSHSVSSRLLDQQTQDFLDSFMYIHNYIIELCLLMLECGGGGSDFLDELCISCTQLLWTIANDDPGVIL